MKDLVDRITGTAAPARRRLHRTVRAALAAPCALALLLALPGGAEGQMDDTRNHRFEFGAFVGGLNDESEFGPGSRSVQLERGTLFGGHLGWISPSNLFLQTDFGYSSNINWVGEAFFTASDPTALRDMSSLTADLSLGYQLGMTDWAEVYGSAGGGLVRWNVDGIGSESQLAGVFGAGARVFLSTALAVRGGVRWRYTPDAMQELRALSGAATDETGMWTVEPTAGLSIVTGRGARDTDMDGVFDPDDACPATPTGAYVDQSGCPLDSDEDGVFDGLDACPSTPRGARVDETGCPMDTDGDSVLDGIDVCPNTPRGARVDEWGCALDSDRDGVADGLDRCPNTQAGVEVDETGCPMDSDGDLVPNGLDECPNTSPDSEVDAVGCPISQVQEDLEEEGRVVLHDVLFDFDMASLRPSARVILDVAADALLRNPHLTVEIQGHTDAIGPDEYNQTLSERRAQAVLEYFRENFPGLEESRLTAKGYGEAEPLESNESEDGRRQNRRVEFVVNDEPESS